VADQPLIIAVGNDGQFCIRKLSQPRSQVTYNKAPPKRHEDAEAILVWLRSCGGQLR